MPTGSSTAVVRPSENGQGDVEAERARLRKEIERGERMLANEKFVANAAPEVVAGRAREARAVPCRARRPRRSIGLSRSARGRRRASGSTASTRCSPRLGDPQARYPAIHVVGTNGKSTTTRLTEALLPSEGVRVGAYFSPHIRSWSERIRVNGAEADFERALGRVRPVAEDATQFEILTAAALLEFAHQEVDVAVVEAGLGGRHDSTNVLKTRVVVLTNVALDHTDVLGDTREAIAAEKLAVVQPGCR